VASLKHPEPTTPAEPVTIDLDILPVAPFLGKLETVLCHRCGEPFERSTDSKYYYSPKVCGVQPLPMHIFVCSEKPWVDPREKERLEQRVWMHKLLLVEEEHYGGDGLVTLKSITRLTPDRPKEHSGIPNLELGERFRAVRKWANEHWGLRLIDARGFESDVTLKPYKRGFVLLGSFPGHGYGQRHYRSLAAVERALEFKKEVTR
jgi:hypothetical protein